MQNKSTVNKMKMKYILKLFKMHKIGEKDNKGNLCLRLFPELNGGFCSRPPPPLPIIPALRGGG